VKIALFRISGGTGVDALLIALLGFLDAGPFASFIARRLALRGAAELITAGHWRAVESTPQVILVPRGYGFCLRQGEWRELKPKEVRAVVAYEKGLDADLDAMWPE
jgi:hypothetical protein